MRRGRYHSREGSSDLLADQDRETAGAAAARSLLYSASGPYPFEEPRRKQTCPPPKNIWRSSPQVDDLRAERDELDAVLATLEADWQRVTGFKDWTVWDVVAHLHLSDHMGITSLSGEEPFRS